MQRAHLYNAVRKVDDTTAAIMAAVAIADDATKALIGRVLSGDIDGAVISALRYPNNA